MPRTMFPLQASLKRIAFRSVHRASESLSCSCNRFRHQAWPIRWRPREHRQCPRSDSMVSATDALGCFFKLAAMLSMYVWWWEPPSSARDARTAQSRSGRSSWAGHLEFMQLSHGALRAIRRRTFPRSWDGRLHQFSQRSCQA